MVKCPVCTSTLSVKDLVVPRFVHPIKCSPCQTPLEYTGIFHWGVELAYLLLSYAIYRLVSDNLLEFLLVIIITLIIMVLQYFFAELKPVKR